jgi:hypothetical protein
MFPTHAMEPEDRRENRQQERGTMIDRNDSRIFRAHSWYWTAAIAIAVMLLGAGATSWAASGKDSAAAPASQLDRPAPLSGEAAAAHPPSMDQRYAARETNSKRLETFKGGDVVIIGASGLVIVLLVVLIIVII